MDPSDSAGSARPRGLRDLEDCDRVFGALAHATRRHILQVLHARNGAMSAGELAGRFEHSWPTTSRHLRVLVAAGLIRERRQGRTRHYVLDRDRVTTVLDLWLPSIGVHHAHQGHRGHQGQQGHQGPRPEP